MGFSVAKTYCFWCSENPDGIVPKQVHTEYVTDWCGFTAGGIIGQYFGEK